jgi:hypothetical protein
LRCFAEKRKKYIYQIQLYKNISILNF